jgi:hypothetical protein
MLGKTLDHGICHQINTWVLPVLEITVDAQNAVSRFE